jgi:hypothetical protein
VNDTNGTFDGMNTMEYQSAKLKKVKMSVVVKKSSVTRRIKVSTIISPPAKAEVLLTSKLCMPDAISSSRSSLGCGSSFWEVPSQRLECWECTTSA